MRREKHGEAIVRHLNPLDSPSVTHTRLQLSVTVQHNKEYLGPAMQYQLENCTECTSGCTAAEAYMETSQQAQLMLDAALSTPVTHFPRVAGFLGTFSVPEGATWNVNSLFPDKHPPCTPVDILATKLLPYLTYKRPTKWYWSQCQNLGSLNTATGRSWPQVFI